MVGDAKRRRSMRLQAGRDERGGSGSGSDDDFETSAQEFVEHIRNDPEMAEMVLTPEEEARYPTIKTRGTTRQLLRAVSSLNARQRQAVREIGFGHLLHLGFRETPQRLGHWLVTNFNPCDLSLTVQGDRKIRIGREDVAACLGLPMGGVAITVRGKHEVGPMLREWRSILGSPEGNITPTEVCDALLADKAGGAWFKRHFSVIVATTLIESNQNGYANQQILHMLDDVMQIENLDWCGYLLQRLVHTHGDWSEHKVQKYTGPIVFLTILYMDRVVFGSRSVPRFYPALRGWTTKLLNQRQLQEIKGGGFGMGDIDVPLRPGMSFPSLPASVPGSPTVLDGLSHHVPGRTDQASEPQIFLAQFTDTVKALAASVVDMVEMVRHAPPKVALDENFKHMVDVTQMLLGLREVPSSDRGLRDNPFWAKPENLKTLDVIEKAIAMREALRDMPSFSPGPTQDVKMLDSTDMEVIEKAIEMREALRDMPSFSTGLTQDVKMPNSTEINGDGREFTAAATTLVALDEGHPAQESVALDEGHPAQESVALDEGHPAQESVALDEGHPIEESVDRCCCVTRDTQLA
ncbi:PREDICTED: uncharacterized protein LOC109155364 [Ipomoea nil]|uniref:uncharacterized protein LOC109155364 n=1 Tax=Ipomoea nil TaxID=35883 RepID=UPI0009011BAB|nr:PREDICTED: uncharacterized protein LOC109155364 [Ipomoea nil]